MNNPSKRKQRFKGKIVSLPSPKTAVIEVESFLEHPKYRRYFKRSKKYSAAYENGEFKIGEKVIIESSRPLSKTKKWVIKSVS